MIWYILKLLVLLPLIAAMIWGSLKLSQRMQGRLLKAGGQKSVRIIETAMLSPTLKLAVLEFHGREILVSVSRAGLTRLAEAPARGPVLPDSPTDAYDWDEDAGPTPTFAQALRRTQP